MSGGGGDRPEWWDEAAGEWRTRQPGDPGAQARAYQPTQAGFPTAPGAEPGPPTPPQFTPHPDAPYSPGPGYEEPRPEPPPRGDRKAAIGIAAALVFGAGLAAAGFWLFGGEDETPAKPGPGASSPAEQKDEKPPKGEGEDKDSAKPSDPGYVTARGEGFTFLAPQDWARRAKGAIVFYEENGQAEQFVQVYEVTETRDPYEAVRIIERTKRSNSGYVRNGLRDYDDYSEYDYSYTDSAYGPRRALVRDQRTPDGKLYALVAVGPADGWPEQRQRMDQLANSLCSGADCPS
ncbi:hypothetical protein G5C51_29145 [Streptomyces sp. A7024]|uniref:Serine/arginine repetitive matrix protein 2 n=1 Tax=Streptomyces coryli TaxID=1128680 RepID=A0A6G4U7H8_9ACTN|nr:hypothetical protein [Streptomyces coryli]NGN67952.1 hypothetical protein [Streptomyces coryli]